jgi:mannose-1-phosphate guanylyltransferase
MIINLILSGGSGTRLWPLSTNQRPKQFIPLFSGISLFQECLIRNQHIADKSIVVLNKSHVEIARDQADLPGIKNIEFIEEKIARNTAPAIAFAAIRCFDDDILLVSPADHIIEKDESYYNSINRAISLASKGFLVTFGIKPLFPEVGFGYIQHEGENVIAFHEKPNEDLARKYVESGTYLWNSGMFCFTAKTYLDALSKYQPEVLKFCNMVIEEKDEKHAEEHYHNIPSISIDHAVMEFADNIKVIPSNFTWTDVGSFDALSDYLQKRDHQPTNTFLNSSNSNFIINEGNKPIALIGVDDIMVIQTDQGILICKKGESQKVKEIYSDIKKITC